LRESLTRFLLLSGPEAGRNRQSGCQSPPDANLELRGEGADNLCLFDGLCLL